MEKKPFTLRLTEQSIARLDELSSKHAVSKQNLIDLMIEDFDDGKPAMVAKLAERKYAKYKTPVRRQVDKLADLIGNTDLDESERQELRRLLGEA